MSILDAIILSVIEGITEFLPISSTGHLVLTSFALSIPQTSFVKSFEILIQLGAILAVVSLYWRRLISGFEIWKRILIAFIPTAVVGITLYRVIKDILIGNPMITVIALFVGGIILILIEYFYKEKEHHISDVEKISYRQSFIIGIFQSLSIVPGVSRAAATIIGGLLTGAKRKAAVEFSFLLAIPTMFAATALDLKESNLAFTSEQILLIGVGLITSFIVALLAVKFLIKYVQHNNFIPFGVYRILLAIIYWLVFLR
jgi:undecaprenyl-diphosphatase